MFCEPDNPCPAHPIKTKKSAARPRKQSESSSSSPASPSVSLTAPVLSDVNAAMKAAAGSVVEERYEGDAKGRTMEERRRHISRLEEEKQAKDREHSELAGDADFVYTLNMLEPILHPDERRRWSDILDTPSSRALRWRERNNV